MPKEASLVSSLIQEFLSLGSVVNNVANEEEGDPVAQGIPAPAP